MKFRSDRAGSVGFLTPFVVAVLAAQILQAGPPASHEKPSKTATPSGLAPASVRTGGPDAEVRGVNFREMRMLGTNINQKPPQADAKVAKSFQSPPPIGSQMLSQMQAGNPRGAVLEWQCVGYCWDATGLAYHPLYFEEINLERHGYGPKGFRIIQPAISAAHFFATIPALPYLMVADPPQDCVYALGYYRPGSCVPYQISHPPLDLKAGLAETGVVTGMIFLIP